jgi:predicted site-specific integrase-resolvase
MLNTIQTAARLNMSVVTLRKMRDAGQLPPHSNPTPGRFLWREEDIERFAGLFPRNMIEFNKSS